MVEILRNQSLATKFQIMAEIAAHQPNVQQRYIARSLKVTPQAVSEYIRQLIAEGWLVSEGRSRYRLSVAGVDWLIKRMREAEEYLQTVEKAVVNIRVSAAVARERLARGQKVGLLMREGLLVATSDLSSGASGVATSDAEEGQDVGVSHIQGIIALEAGRVTILEVPAMARGGSAMVDGKALARAIEHRSPVIASGVEALIALRRQGIPPDCVYGVIEAAVEAASRGLAPAVLCTSDDMLTLIKRLEDVGIKYEVVDLRRG